MALVTALIATLGGLALTTGLLRRWVGDYVVTIAHEGGHAVVATLYGEVTGIRLRSHATARRTGVAGDTASWTSRRGRVPVSLAGYLAPAALGLGVLALLRAEHTKGALAVMVAALAIMLALIRNLFDRQRSLSPEIQAPPF